MSALVGLVGCCRQKAPRACEARDLYLSPLFRGARAYVERRTPTWAVLSAKHGVVLPGDFIEPYDETLNSYSWSMRIAWASAVREDLRRRFPGATFLVLAGGAYRVALEGLPHEVPLDGLSIGLQLQMLKRDRQGGTT